MKKSFKNILIQLHLYKSILKVRGLLVSIKRWALGTDQKIIKQYFEKYQVKKLHLGCGIHTMEGWLNSDFVPKSSQTLFLDATTRFPFEDNTFDYVFSEHMIEHISYPHGFNMLSECQRVLKPDGKIRISTPDLQFLMDLYQGEKTELQRKYIHWTTDNFVKSAPYASDTFVVNNFFRAWGHLFIYDKKTLRAAFERAGFRQVTSCELDSSEHEAFQNLEYEERMPEGFVELESLILEGVK